MKIIIIVIVVFALVNILLLKLRTSKNIDTKMLIDYLHELLKGKTEDEIILKARINKTKKKVIVEIKEENKKRYLSIRVPKKHYSQNEAEKLKDYFSEISIKAGTIKDKFGYTYFEVIVTGSNNEKIAKSTDIAVRKIFSVFGCQDNTKFTIIQ